MSKAVDKTTSETKADEASKQIDKSKQEAKAKHTAKAKHDDKVKQSTNKDDKKNQLSVLDAFGVETDDELEALLVAKKEELAVSVEEIDKLIEVIQGDTLYGETLEETRILHVEDRINARLDYQTQAIIQLMARKLSAPKEEQQEVVRVLLDELSDDERQDLLRAIRAERRRLKDDKRAQYDHKLVDDNDQEGVYQYKY